MIKRLLILVSITLAFSITVHAKENPFITLLDNSNITYSYIKDLNNSFTRKSLNRKLCEYLPTDINTYEYSTIDTKYIVLKETDFSIELVDEHDYNSDKESYFSLVFNFTKVNNKYNIDYYTLEERFK